MEYVIRESAWVTIEHCGIKYVAYLRQYNTGDYDVEVFPEGKVEETAPDGAYDYAWKYFEELGAIK